MPWKGRPIVMRKVRSGGGGLELCCRRAPRWQVAKQYEKLLVPTRIVARECTNGSRRGY